MERTDLDHVALAAADTAPALRFLTGELGGTVVFGGQAVGFRPMQVWVGTADGEGMSVELLEPWDTERNDFLARFVARHGCGPHHLTFKVPDLAAALDRVRAAGCSPVNVDTSDPSWKEAFLLPREAHGTVVQLAESHGDFPSRRALLAHVAANGPNAHPRWWVDPVAHDGPPARLVRVVLRTTDLAGARALYEGLLDGEPERETAGALDLVWPGGGRLRIEERPGAGPGVDRLEVAGLPRAVEVLGTSFVPAGD